MTLRGVMTLEYRGVMTPTYQQLRQVLADLFEAVARGDEYGMPEAYRAARAALADSDAEQHGQCDLKQAALELAEDMAQASLDIEDDEIGEQLIRFAARVYRLGLSLR